MGDVLLIASLTMLVVSIGLCGYVSFLIPTRRRYPARPSEDGSGSSDLDESVHRRLAESLSNRLDLDDRVLALLRALPSEQLVTLASQTAEDDIMAAQEQVRTLDPASVRRESTRQRDALGPSSMSHLWTEIQEKASSGTGRDG